MGKIVRGKISDAKGRLAEAAVEAWYVAQGARCLEQRWRGQAGEIDLIFQSRNTLHIVEVKSSDTHDQAAALLRPRQIARVWSAAEEYLAAACVARLSVTQFDLATVDCTGTVRVLGNIDLSVVNFEN